MDDTNERGRAAANAPSGSPPRKEAKASRKRPAPEVHLVLDDLVALGASEVFRSAVNASGRLPTLWPRNSTDSEFRDVYRSVGGDPDGGQYAKDLSVLVAATWRGVLKQVAEDSEFGALMLADVSGSDRLGLGSWLSGYAEAFTGDPAHTDRAVALAREWSGPVFAEEVRRVAAGMRLAGDDQVGALLALAAARS